MLGTRMWTKGWIWDSGSGEDRENERGRAGHQDVDEGLDWSFLDPALPNCPALRQLYASGHWASAPGTSLEENMELFSLVLLLRLAF